MNVNQPLWANWSRVLHRWGINEIVASLLGGAGFLSLLAAQVLYITQPLLSGVVSAQSLQAFAQTLENPAEKQAFISLLMEAPSRGTGA